MSMDQLRRLSAQRALRRGLRLWAYGLVVSFNLSACADSARGPVPLADAVDVDSMYGGWYIVATIPNRFEKGMLAPYDVYSPSPKGGIREDFYVRRGSFASPQKHFVVHDWIRPATHNAQWRVQILWPITVPFLVLYVEPGYQHVLFGENNRELGWIYSRVPDMDEPTYQRLLAVFASRGYDVSRFRRVIQHPEQIGQPGFWSEDIRPLPLDRNVR